MAFYSSSGHRCLQSLLTWANFVLVCCGIALMAMCIYFIYDHEGVYVLVDATGSESVWRAAWIGLFTGFAFICVPVFGMYAIMKSSKKLIFAYFILMLIVFAFEMASAITAATHKDWFSPNLFLKEMLQYYNKPLPGVVPSNQDEIYKIKGVTAAWNRIMIEKKCCGVNGPQDWVTFDSYFRQQNIDADYPWPRQCCQQDAMGAFSSLDGCKIGLNPYLSNTGCYPYIGDYLRTFGLAVSWFGFSILCWTFLVLLGMMAFYILLDY
ncbi:uroplakin-1b-like [Scleropages formosus]|nr:uroplakin-1b [Scleropages formosus]XP_018591852.1 uroplakin-1b [Scleropages formosus]